MTNLQHLILTVAQMRSCSQTTTKPSPLQVRFHQSLHLSVKFFNRHLSRNGLFHLISAPPGLRADLSLLPLKNAIKKCYPLKTSLRNGFTPKNFTKKVFTPEEFHEISVYP